MLPDLPGHFYLYRFMGRQVYFVMYMYDWYHLQQLVIYLLMTTGKG